MYDNWNEYYIDFMIDTAFNVWMYDTTYYCCDTVLWYKLNAEPGESWITRNYNNEYFEKCEFDSSYSGIFWGDTVTYAVFSIYTGWYDSIDSTLIWQWGRTHILASNFGLVRTYSEGTGGKVLRGIIIDGVQKGDTTYTSIVEGYPNLPEKISLTNYPNPFNNNTIIMLDVFSRCYSSLNIFDISGRLVYTFWEGKRTDSGLYSLTWDGSSNRGNNISSGVYLIVFKTEYSTLSKSVLFIK